MTPVELKEMLYEMLTLPEETEWIEFKEAKNDYDFDDLGQYFSALSNEANLKGKQSNWLVFGVTDKLPRKICGTSYRKTPPGLQRLKMKVAEHTNHQITFREIHELFEAEMRVLLFEIPPAPKGIPTTWNGVAYGRIHESLYPLSISEIDQIRKQVMSEDWSIQICDDASINDLDPQAISFARLQYKNRNPGLATEVDQWDDITFLNKAKVCIDGKITRAAVVLLGKNVAEHFLSPAVTQITWVLKDESDIVKDHEHFRLPLILAVDQAFSKIRNLTYRYIPDTGLFPHEIKQYDPWVIRETLHNAIAHQDYTQGARINIVEESDSLLFTNLGEFLPGSVEEVISRDAPPELYRNRCLAEAMVNFNMIETIGSGIKRMFKVQQQRSFPMPDYDLSEQGRVKVRIIGKVIDERYTRTVMTRKDLTLNEVIALDKVQKGKSLAEDEFTSLKKKRLIEGRRPNLFVSAEVAAATDTRAEYIKKRAFDKGYYKKLVVDYLTKFGMASREDIDHLLINKISDALNDKQKKTVITNLLQEMRRDGSIKPLGKTRYVKWTLSK